MSYTLREAIEITIAEETNLPLTTARELVKRIEALMGADRTPVAWIIEREDRLPSITHYEGVAKVEEGFGSMVTPYHSRWPV